MGLEEPFEDFSGVEKSNATKVHFDTTQNSSDDTTNISGETEGVSLENATNISGELKDTKVIENTQKETHCLNTSNVTRRTTIRETFNDGCVIKRIITEEFVDCEPYTTIPRQDPIVEPTTPFPYENLPTSGFQPVLSPTGGGQIASEGNEGVEGIKAEEVSAAIDDKKELGEKERRNATVVVYLIGLIIFAFAFYYVIYRRISIVVIVLVGVTTAILLMLNLYFAYINPLQSYDAELAVYSYVELNARTLAAVALAIVLLVNIYTERNPEKLQTFISIVLFSFIFSVSILIIVWMPLDEPFYIRILRDVKTCLLLYAISFLICGMIYFVWVKVV